MHHRESLTLVLLGLTVTGAPCVGQGAAVGPSILTLLPYGEKRVSMEDRVAGALTVTDFRAADDRHVQAWAFEGQAGQSVTFDLVSEDFDAYLYVVGPGAADVLQDDDGGGGCQARIVLTLQDAGVLRVIVSSQSLRATGAFTLAASSSPGPVRPGSCGSFNADIATFRSLPIAGALSLAEAVTGELSSGDRMDDGGSYVQAWALAAEANMSVTIDLVSDDFDAMLYLIGTGLSGALTDDDGGGGCHARLTTTLPESGSYRVIASSLSPGMTGAFTLSVTDEPGPVSDRDCLGARPPGFQLLGDLPLDGRTLRQDVEQEGRLTEEDVRYGDGSFVQAWGLEVVQGTPYTVDLRSDDFDAFLYVVGPGIDDVLTDDDSGGGCHARLTVDPSETAVLRVVVSSIGAGQTGTFQLRLSGEPGPVDPTSCRQRGD